VVGLLPVLALPAIDAGLILDLFAKEATLTGRTDLWSFVINNITERPMLGRRYLAFWTPANPRAGRISEAVGWYVPQAHNGILGLLLQIGVLATALCGFLFVRNTVLAVRCIHGHAKASGLTSFAFLIALALIGSAKRCCCIPTKS
jgi:exopolysaccharide production protein ExoQ